MLYAFICTLVELVSSVTYIMGTHGTIGYYWYSFQSVNEILISITMLPIFAPPPLFKNMSIFITV